MKRRLKEVEKEQDEEEGVKGVRLKEEERLVERGGRGDGGG